LAPVSHLESTCAKALSKLDPMALFYSGTLAPIYTGIDTNLVKAQIFPFIIITL
jgi:hypothetical protein